VSSSYILLYILIEIELVIMSSREVKGKLTTGYISTKLHIYPLVFDLSISDQLTEDRLRDLVDLLFEDVPSCPLAQCSFLAPALLFFLSGR